MKAAEAARAAGVSVKALRYYEARGLIAPARRPNGYRTYSALDLDVSRQVAALLRLGLSAEQTRPFVACLRQGHAHGDSCAESLAAYRDEVTRLDTLIEELGYRRDALQARLRAASARGFPDKALPPPDVSPGAGWPRAPALPRGLPVPADDGRAAHLPGLTLPDLTLRAHSGEALRLRGATGRRLLFVYPMTGVPGEDLPDGWDSIPGARGCTAEACGFRDHLGDLLAAGAGAVLGLSHQGGAYQAELARRLHLPYPLLSDPDMRVGAALQLPTFSAGGARYYARLTLVLRGDVIEHVFYPVFPPQDHAAQVLAWLRSLPSAPGSGSAGADPAGTDLPPAP